MGEGTLVGWGCCHIVFFSGLREVILSCGASSHHPLSPPPLSTLARAERGAEQPYVALVLKVGSTRATARWVKLLYILQLYCKQIRGLVANMA